WLRDEVPISTRTSVHQTDQTMTLDEFRREMEAYRQAAKQEGEEFKSSYLAHDRLVVLYRRFNPEERAMAEHVLAEWMLSQDPDVRFDARALIDDFRIVTALPALEKLAERLASSRAVGAPAELEVVNRIIRDLVQVKFGAAG
ncbi:MAG: hypothetical protein ACJ8F2_17045, partial [Xanthobacteraceae bacterium]